MALKFRIFGKQFGFGIAETMLSMAMGAILIGGGVSYFGHVSTTTASSSVLQDRTSRVTESLNRTAQNVQVSDPVLYAAPDQLMTASVDGAGNKVMTRWVKASNAYYQQTWSGYTGSYMPDPGLWISTGVPSASAPNGDGTQTTMTLIADMSATGTPIFAYSGATGNVIDTSVAPLTTAAGNTNQVKLVNISLAAATVAPQFYANSTSAAPRNTSAGVSDGTVVAPICPAVSFTAASTPTQPELTWTAVPGATSYVIYRNATVAATPADPTTTWKDTANPAGVTDSTTYRVLAKAADGTTSDSCRPLVWRPQIGQPVLKASTVVPSVAAAAGWTGSPLTGPRISLAWDAVTGTSGYELLYREVNVANGAPIGTGAFTNVQVALGQLSYNFDTGGWGRRYEWYLRANARSGQSSESRSIQFLTHPAAPVSSSITAAYADNVNGTNTLTWPAVSTAVRYEVWRYNAGNSGAATLAGSTTSLTFTDTVPYGTNYTYYVVAVNSGPRGTDAAGADVTADRASPTPESAASSKPVLATQLQYPPIPVMAPMSLAPGSTRDFTGTNHLEWAAAASATGYLAQRYTVGAGTPTCITGACATNSGGTTATSLDDPQAAGTQFLYAVIAYNATGVSKTYSLKATLTQAPPAPPLTVTRAPDLSNDSADFSSSQTIDVNQASADRYCTSSTCTYELDKDGASMGTFNHAQTGSSINWNNMANAQGATLNYTVKAKNAALTNGGWSTTTSKIVLTYPGPFAWGQSLGDANGWGQTRFRVNLVSTDTSGSSTGIQNGYETLWYGASGGATWFDFSRTTASSHEGISSDPNEGLPGGGVPYGAYGGGNANHWTLIASPGTIYRHDVVAHAANGLARGVTTNNFWTPPDVPYTGTTMITCSGNQYSDQNTATWNWPNHHIGTRLIAFNHGVLFGDYSGTSIIGMQWYQGQGPTDTNWTYLNWWDGSPDIPHGPGQGYYYGVNNGERIWNNINGGPNSTILWQSIQAYATFNSGCGPYGGYWWDLYEPTWACYGYVPGQPCYANNPWNRPQWHTF
ncbi:MAG TPA: hypothetical protein VF867_01155 [Arthrobacter sp.]